MTAEAALAPLDIEAQVQAAVDAMLDLKGVDLRVLHLAPITDFTEYFLVVAGTNSRQVVAIADAVEERLSRRKIRPLHTEGQNQGSWILLDFGDFIVHVFDEERRGFYGLERLWGDAPNVTSQFTGAAAS
jgi:ribosome-associated protein